MKILPKGTVTPFMRYQIAMDMMNAGLLTHEEALKALDLPNPLPKPSLYEIYFENTSKPKCVCGAEKCKTTHADWCEIK